MADTSKIQGYNIKDANARENITLISGRLDNAELNIQTLQNDIKLSKESANSFNDGIDSYFKKVVSTIEPVQAGSGTPSPTNVRTISGFTECTVLDRQINQWDEDWEVGDISRTTGQNSPADSQIRSKNYILVSPDTSYYIGLFKTGEVSIAVCYYDAGKNFISAQWGANGPRRTPINCRYIRFTTNAVYGDTYNNDISINYPATDTSYHAYNGTTATISFGSAGTVYGGTVDLTSGILTVDRAYTTINSITGTWVREATSTSGVYRWSVQISPTSAIQAVATEGFMASMLANSSGNDIYAGRASDNSVGFNVTNIYVRCDSATDTTELTNILGSCQIVYSLATPQTYQLTPTQLRSLVGTNNLTSNTGDTVEVEYITNTTIAWLLDLIIQTEEANENLDVSENIDVDDIVEAEIEENIEKGDSK